MARDSERALEARKKALEQSDVASAPAEGLGCIERLMAAGRSRDEAERLCGEHKKNVAAAKKRDSALGRLMSIFGK